MQFPLVWPHICKIIVLWHKWFSLWLSAFLVGFVKIATNLRKNLMYFCLMITMFGVYYNTSNYLEFSLSTNVNRIHKTFLFVLKCHYYDKHRIRHMYTRKYLKHQHFLTLSLFQSCKNEFVLRKLHKGRSGRKSVTKQTSPPIYCHIKIITMGVNG